MKIATYNVNGIGARLSALLRWMAESKPDVVCLQELKAPQDKFPEAEVRAAGYGVIWHGQKSFNGVAILARGRDPVESRRGLPGGSSLARLLAEHRGVRNFQQLPPLTEEQVLKWIDEHKARKGEWPTSHSGGIFGSAGERWPSRPRISSLATRELSTASSVAWTTAS